MNAAISNRSDFSLGQCRDALAKFDKQTLEQVVIVMTCHSGDRVENAANHPEFGRAMFWVNEWIKHERIQTRQEIFQRLKLVQAIRLDRKERFRNAAMWTLAGACTVTLTAQTMLAITA